MQTSTLLSRITGFGVTVHVGTIWGNNEVSPYRRRIVRIGAAPGSVQSADAGGNACVFSGIQIVDRRYIDGRDERTSHHVLQGSPC